ncbi:MAG: hypothetical protein AAFU34_15705 [Pseudomonadota bacterium]
MLEWRKISSCPEHRDVLLWMDDCLTEFVVLARYVHDAETLWDQNDFGYQNNAGAWAECARPDYLGKDASKDENLR